MNTFRVSFLALSRSFDFEMKSDMDIIPIFNDFMSAFITDIDYENFTIKINSLQQNTKEFREKLDLFIQKYKNNKPEIQKLNTYFKDFVEDEYFFFLPNCMLPKEQINQLYTYLIAMRDNIDYEILSKQMDTDFAELFNNYDINVFGEHTKNKIGESNKSKRICRFCGKDSSKVTFKKVAHTISEALENKKIVTNDECDNCNKKFGEGIENDLITYLNPYRIFFGVKGKNGIPKLKEKKNFEIENTGTGTINIGQTLTDEEIEKLDEIKPDDFKLKLETNQTITAQNVYRTLAKYALGTIDSANIENFTETIEWINCKKNFDNLPKVAILQDYSLFLSHPQLMVYLRKNDNQNFPYAVAEFGFTFFRFVYIIPATNKDSVDFTEEENYKTFWNFFKHYSSGSKWTFTKMNDNIARKCVMNLNFEKQKNNEQMHEPPTSGLL